MFMSGPAPREGSLSLASPPDGAFIPEERLCVPSGTKASSIAASPCFEHESLHPLTAPLAYGGRIPVPADCTTALIKLNSRSCTLGPGVRLGFFESQAAMRANVKPLRTMYGKHQASPHVALDEFYEVSQTMQQAIFD